MEETRKERLLLQVAKYRLRGAHLRSLEPNNLKSDIANIAQAAEFSGFSKDELLKIFKQAAIEKLEEMIKALKEAKF